MFLIFYIINQIAEDDLRHHRIAVLPQKLNGEVVGKFGGEIKTDLGGEIDVADEFCRPLRLRRGAVVCDRKAHIARHALLRVVFQPEICVGVGVGREIVDTVRRNEGRDPRAEIAARGGGIARKSDAREQHAHDEKIAKIGKNGDLFFLNLPVHLFSQMLPSEDRSEATAPRRPQAR